MVELEKRNRLSPDMNGIGTFVFRRLVLRVRALMLNRCLGGCGQVQRVACKASIESLWRKGHQAGAPRKEDAPLHWTSAIRNRT